MSADGWDDFLGVLVARIRDDPLCADVIAAEIGGSAGRRDTDEFSDLDLFLYLEQPALASFIDVGAVELIRAIGTFANLRGPDYKPVFGWGYAADYDRYGLVSFRLRGRDDIRPHFMRAGDAHIVHDPEGLLARVNAASRSLPIPRQEIASQAVAECYNRFLQVGKEAARGNLWQARKYYRDILEELLKLARLQSDRPPRGRNYRHSGRGMERDLPATLVERVRALDLASTSALTAPLLDETIALLGELADALPERTGDVDWETLSRRLRRAFADERTVAP